MSIGSSLSPGRFSHAIPDAAEKKIIVCDINENNVNKIYHTDHALIGDARVTLQALIDELAKRTSGAGIGRDNIVSEILEERQKDELKYRDALNSSETPINPYRVYADIMKVIDPQKSFVTHESGNTRDQLSTVYETQIPRGFLGWGNVSSLGFSLPAAMAAKIAYPERHSIAVTGEAGLGYMLGNLEVPVRENIGITVIHISNGGFSGYGPGFWGDGHDPYTHKVLSYDNVDMSKVIGEMGLHAERIYQPDDIVGAIERAMAAYDKGQPAYIEFVCIQYPVYGSWVSGSHGE